VRWTNCERRADKKPRKKMQRQVLFGVHIPKCAGTTLLDRVTRCLPSNQIYQTTSMIRNYQEGKSEFLQLLRRDRLRFVFGHTVHEEMLKYLSGSVVLFTGLREPVSRLESELNYKLRLSDKQKNERPNIEEHLSRINNPVCRFLVDRFPTFAGTDGTLADRAMQVLESFQVVYFAENFEETAKTIFALLGISPPPLQSNVGDGDRIAISPGSSQLAFDVELYERARQAFCGTRGLDEIEMKNPKVDQFRKTPKNENKLRRFLYSSTYGEYKSWKVTDDVIRQKLRLIDEMSVEIATYIDRRSEETRLKSVSDQAVKRTATESAS
jgi:hypothetical protein